MKEVSCRDLGMADDFVARGDTEEDVMRKMEQHAREVHGMDQLDEELRRQIRENIRES